MPSVWPQNWDGVVYCQNTQRKATGKERGSQGALGACGVCRTGEESCRTLLMEEGNIQKKFMKIHKNLHFFKLLHLYSGYRQSTMFWLLKVDRLRDSATHTHVSMCPLNSPPIQAVTWRWAEFPVMDRRSLLVLHGKYSRVSMSIPDSLTIPSPINPQGKHKSVLWVLWVCFCLVSSHESFHFRSHKCVNMYMEDCQNIYNSNIVKILTAGMENMCAPMNTHTQTHTQTGLHNLHNCQWTDLRRGSWLKEGQNVRISSNQLAKLLYW